MSTTPRQLRNLKKLRTILSHLPDEQCDMKTWFSEIPDRLAPPTKRGTPGCGTTACLAGWGAVLFTPSINGKARVRWPNAVRYSVGASEAALLVPKVWATRQRLPVNADFYEVRRGRSVYVVVDAKRLGRWALGDDAARLFVPNHGAAQDYTSRTLLWGSGGHESDREWMISKLDALITRLTTKGGAECSGA